MTLTELSVYTRRALPLVIILFLLLMIFFYSFKLLFLYLQNENVITTGIKTNTVFGKIKSPKITTATVSANFQYTLDTIEGEPVSATPAATVYYIPQAYSTTNFRQQIYVMAKAAGFDTEVVKHKLNGTEAVFSDDKRQLSIDITNFNFNYEYYLKNLKEEDETFFNGAVVPKRENIEQKAVDFLNSIGRYPTELAQGKRNLVYLSYDSATNNLTLDSKLTSSNMVEVDFYRADIGQSPIVSPKYFNSQDYVIIAFSQEDFRIIKAQVRFFEKSDTQVGIYPVIKGTEAWSNLKNNKAMIVSAPSDQTAIKIRKVFLGYLDPDVYQEYLQPVYVFLGDNDFVAYMPALSSQYYLE